MPRRQSATVSLMRDETATETAHRSDVRLRRHVPEAPAGESRLRWWGPGLLWAMSAVGSGSVLFTPRVGSEYGYTFLWLLWSVAFLMWVMIREAGRFAVATGRTLLDGFSTLPGPRNWALWVVFLPQLLAAVAGVGGLSALVGSALGQELPGGLVLWSLVVLAASTAVVVSGGYRAVSRAALLLALVLAGLAVVAAGRVFGSVEEAAAGLVPTVPGDTDVPFLLPWVGTILAGSMGIVWFSYWTTARGYGGGSPQASAGDDTGTDAPVEDTPDELRGERLAAWFRTLSNTAVVGVLTGTLIITAFLVLGAELLGPQGIVPSGTDVAEDLTRLLSEVWGAVGHWLMVAAIVVALGGSVLANQDGWSRSFADITLLLHPPSWLLAPLRVRPDGVALRRSVKTVFAVVVTSLLPAAVVVVVRDPVTIMSASGIVATVHTPFIVLSTLAVNRRIPEPMRPGLGSTLLLGLAGLFYTVFAVLYFANLLGLIGG
jgi:Mn2+/Fe2+ NRAMP family transporter